MPDTEPRCTRKKQSGRSSSKSRPAGGPPLLAGMWLVWVASILTMGLFGMPGGAAWALVGVSALGAMVLLLREPSPMGTIFALGFLQRLVWMFLDLATNVPVFSSGADTEDFYRETMRIFSDPSLLSEPMRLGTFSKPSALLFMLAGPHRVVVQFTNVLLGTSTFVLLARTLQVLGVKQRSTNIVVGIAALMPIGAIMQSIFLREAPVSFFVAVSVYGFSVYLMRGSAWGLLAALTGIVAASYFHAGVIGLLVGYFIALLLYDRNSGRFQLSVGRLALAVPLTVGFTVALLAASNVVLKKFRNVESFDDVAHTAGRSMGDSAYSETKDIESFSDFGPQVLTRAVNFIGSPYPWRWRGMSDVFAFTLDATVFIAFTVLVILGLRATASRQRALLAVFAMMLAGALFIFAVGTGNAGTAMRHRQKLVVPFAVAAALAIDARESRRKGSTADPLAVHNLGDPGDVAVPAAVQTP